MIKPLDGSDISLGLTTAKYINLHGKHVSIRRAHTLQLNMFELTMRMAKVEECWVVFLYAKDLTVNDVFKLLFCFCRSLRLLIRLLVVEY